MKRDPDPLGCLVALVVALAALVVIYAMAVPLLPEGW